jgi:hypothetical protein
MKIKMTHFRARGFKIIVLFALQGKDPGYMEKEAGSSMLFGVASMSATEYPTYLDERPKRRMSSGRWN